MQQQKHRSVSRLTLVGLALLSGPAMAFTAPLPEPEVLGLLGAGVAAALIAGKLRGRK